MRIQGLGVIDDAVLELSGGLTVVTGETGAGKTMVVTGLHLLFGGRADAARIRKGADRAVIEGRLRLPPGSVAAERATEAGAEFDEDGTLIVSRVVLAGGRSRAYLGGRAVPVGVLAELGEELLAIHGQSDQMRLLRPAQQRMALDRYGGEPVLVVLEQHRECFIRWRSLDETLRDRISRARELNMEAELLRHGLADIKRADPQPGEDHELASEAARLAHVDALRLAAKTAHAALMGDSIESAVDTPDVTTLLGTARRSLDQESDRDVELAALRQRLDDVSYSVTDIAGDLLSYVDGLEADPLRLSQVEERRSVLRSLTRRYADTIDEVLQWARDAESKLAALDTTDETLQQMAAERDAAEAELVKLAEELSSARSKAAIGFSDAVTHELAGLAMSGASVVAQVRARRNSGGITVQVDGEPLGIGPDGADEVELLLRAQPDAPGLPLTRGASGGELSRVMLAVEVVFADADPLPTMVFDEVDAGVGGRSALEVGKRLAQLAASHQVIVVTHLPQVAAYADNHFAVNKTADGAVTRSAVCQLDGDARVQEMVRMLAGAESSELGKAHAAELLTVAQRTKKRLARQQRIKA